MHKNGKGGMRYTSVPYELFARVFRANICARSRTAGGISDISTSKGKKPLVKSGKELEEQVRQNTEQLIDAVWKNPPSRSMDAANVRMLMELWYDIANIGLQDTQQYQKEQEELRLEAECLGKITGQPHRINSRYRVWDVSYTTLCIKPVRLEVVMDWFYAELYRFIDYASADICSQEFLLAFADLIIDGEVHPWMDGCGRIATAAVMWLSLLRGNYALPVFDSRNVHFNSIHDLQAHKAYYFSCFVYPVL